MFLCMWTLCSTSSTPRIGSAIAKSKERMICSQVSLSLHSVGIRRREVYSTYRNNGLVQLNHGNVLAETQIPAVAKGDLDGLHAVPAQSLITFQ